MQAVSYWFFFLSFLFSGYSLNGERSTLKIEPKTIKQSKPRRNIFLYIHRDYAKMVGKGINFVRKPSQEAYGTVAVFEDLYGNLWDLIEYI